MQETNMPKTNFTIKYDGPSLDNHEMDIALLAPALMGMQKVIDELVTASSGNEYRASLKIKGNVVAGSIEIELVTQAISNIQNFKEMIVGLLNTPEVMGSAVLVTLVGPLFALIKKFGIAKPEVVERLENGDIKIQTKNQTTIVNQYVYKVYNKFEVREAVYKVVKPLEDEGIDSFTINENGRKVIHVDESEVERFIPPKIIENTSVTEEITFLQIVKISFEMSNKWQFSLGDIKLNANILDEDFINKVKTSKIAFNHGDVLKVRLLKEQCFTKGRLKTEYSVIEVLEHIKTGKQQNLNLN